MTTNDIINVIHQYCNDHNKKLYNTITFTDLLHIVARCGEIINKAEELEEQSNDEAYEAAFNPLS